MMTFAVNLYDLRPDAYVRIAEPQSTGGIFVAIAPSNTLIDWLHEQSGTWVQAKDIVEVDLAPEHKARTAQSTPYYEKSPGAHIWVTGPVNLDLSLAAHWK